MVYEKVGSEVERILEDKSKPVTGNEIKESSTKLKQETSYSVITFLWALLPFATC
jgi:hypothetical protein